MANRDVVQGFTFESVAEGSNTISQYHGNVCQIVRRATSGDVHNQDILDLGPAFVVAFGDGHEEVVWAGELHPWYPT